MINSGKSSYKSFGVRREGGDRRRIDDLMIRWGGDAASVASDRWG
jgi:hypothetical protein